MRTTQYIGLTKKAQDYVANLERLKDNENYYEGMFHEKIPLGAWIVGTRKDVIFDSNVEDGEDELVTVIEKVQEIPWSSGPMIFTCLEYDAGNGSKYDILQWITDPAVRDREFDIESGSMFV